ncbi:Structural maintenance of chromosomes protein [Pleurostoma richardsiae]|uniref:Structural maintenance of chromosomes protein n=1 Tax=Pleurostoma richardsiae TaxID=41990 RepID=A0AA38VNG0_9PEZI|nr:Structural maintenance of chromosomes protein [Pleurostoma richardsiae]
MGKLIRLELFNFKSYKGHHVLLFGDSYFTSIIGPNGSGKSNSMDAISFVLGLRSAQLRSTQLKDLIYRGRVMKTAKINDDGSIAEPETNGHHHANGDVDVEDVGSYKAARNDPKSAWVMAVYEDDAGDEQKWKRVITPQGSSTYHINDRAVSQEQYSQALEAENILVKAKNFLVFQGDVEAIAQQSPQDLTRMIEQISGSLEYKADYDRLQAALDDATTKQNEQLQKRRMTNTEIRQYQEQKKEAENFQKKTEERDEAVVTHILWKLYHFQRVMDESSAKIQEHQENLKEFRRNVEAYERKLEAARKEQAAVGREVGKIERTINQKHKLIEEKENSLVPIDEKVEQSTRDMETIRKKLETVTKDREDQKKLVQKIKKDLATVEKAQQQFEVQWKESLKQKGKELSEADRKEYQNLRKQAMAKCSENQAKLDALLRQLKSDEATASSLKGKVDSFTAAQTKIESELETITQRKEVLEETVQHITTEIDEKKKEFNQLKSERVRTNNRHTELEEKLQDVLRKIKEADDGRRENDKQKLMKEIVLNLKRLYPGVRGRVGELCKPKQKKYDEAVITALGRDFDSVIVDTEKVGIECVQYLKDNRYPPMTFIPLDNIKVNAVNSAVKGTSGARLTIETIDYDQSLQRAMEYACGSSVVCDTLQIAKDICYRRRLPVKAVTIEGFVIHKSGLMTGGRLPEHKGNKRSFQEHDIQNLRKMEEKLVADLQKLPPADRRGHAEESLQSDLVSLEQRLRAARAELEAFDKNLASKEKELDNVDRQLQEWEPKYSESQQALERTNQTVSKFQKAIAQVEDKIFADFCKRLGYNDIRAYEAQQGSLEQEAAKKRAEFELQKSKLRSTLQWETSRLDGFEARVRDMKANLERLDADVKSYREQKESIEEELGEEQDELAALVDSLEELKTEHAKRAEKVAEAKQEVQKRSRDIEARLKDISALEAEVQRTSASKFALLRRCKLEQIPIPLAAGSLDNLPSEDNLLHQDADAMDIDEGDDEMMEAAMDDYGVEVDFDSLDEDLKNPDDEGIEEKLEERISSLTAALEKMNPNLKVFENLKKSELKLKAEEAEFETSREALKRAREEFNKIKAKRLSLFKSALTHIQEQIQTVYKDLTRSEAYPIGGTAYLDSEEDTDTPYLSGIKYHAMPPLKRFRDMELLSGGEKTIAALALLFAVHSYQPSPFFVLDEVDAALDNANVEKIKKYIREHAGPGMQFIVISLKTALFQDSESLVGVYRDQDVNSSKTLTLDLRKYS